MSVSAPLIVLVNEFGVAQKRNDAFCKRLLATLEAMPSWVSYLVLCNAFVLQEAGDY